MKSKFSTFALLFIAAHHFVVHNGWVTCQTDVEHSEQLAGEPAIRSGNQNIQILYVLECEGPQEWQLVNATDTVVPWMRDLKDRLTVSDDRPDGEDLMIPSWWVHKGAQPAIQPLKGTEFMDDDGHISFYNIIEAQLAADADAVWLPKYLLVLYQLTMVEGGPSVEDLHVTASKSFWQAVEAIAASGNFVYKASLDAAEQAVPSIKGFAVILPTILSVMYGQGEWPEESVSIRYGDHSAWDRPEILEMLQHFFSITQAVSLPELAEYEWRSDKMAQYNLFQKYHDCHPATHTPPIPTVSIQPAVSARVLRNICYRQRYLQDSYTASEEDIRATAAAILEAAQQLDGNPHAQSIWAHDASIADNATRKYVIKRNHAGFARKVIRLTVRLDNWQSTPSLTSLLQPSRHSSIQGQTHSRSNCDAGMSEVCQSGEKTSLQHEPPADNGPSGFVQTSHHTSTQKKRTAPSHESDAEIPLATQEAPLPSASEDIAKQTATQQQLSDKSHDITKPAAAQQEPLDALHDAQQLTARYQERVTQEQPLGELRDAAKPRAAQQQPLDVLHDAQQLLRAAERMLRESCGEDWLLQPLIPDMGTGEYRVNLIGGGEAQGTATDVAAVFTPGEAAQNQMYLYNMTLPHGFFSAAPEGTSTHLGSVTNFGTVKPLDAAREEYETPYFPFPVYKDPVMHKMLVDIALGGAQAFKLAHRPNRMVQHVLLRIDVALTRQGSQMKAFINEAHYYADATIMFPVWPPEAKTLYTCSSDSTSSEAIGNQSTTTGKPSNTDSVDAAVRLVHCPKGMPKHPKNAVTGWGGWMADMLWNEVQWQYKAAQSSHPLKAAASA